MATYCWPDRAEGGYWEEMFVEQPVEHILKCPLCFNVLRDPESICREGHTYCSGCIQKDRARNRCPECRGPKMSPSVRNRIARALIEGMAVLCPYSISQGGSPTKRRMSSPAPAKVRQVGCDWIGKLCDLGAHLAGDCPLHPVACSGAILGCKFVVPRAEVSEHQRGCAEAMLDAVCASCREAYGKLQERQGAGAGVSSEGTNRCLPMHGAAHRGHAECVGKLLLLGVVVDALDQRGTTPLYHAACAGHNVCVRLLLKAGARAVATGAQGFTPLYAAAHQGHLKVVKELLLGVQSVHRDAANSNGETALFVAARKGRLDVLKALLAGGADKNRANARGQTPLYACAALIDGAPIVRELVKAGADKNAAAEDGRTPLHLAAREGQLEVVGMLVEAGADLDAANSGGDTPLFAAVANGHLDVVNALLAAGASTAANQRHESPLTEAIRKGLPELALEMLRRTGERVGEEHEDVAAAIEGVAVYFSEQVQKIAIECEAEGKFSEALKSYEHALGQSKMLLGDEHRVVTQALEGLPKVFKGQLRTIGRAYREKGQYTEALKSLEEVHDESKRVLGIGHSVVSLVLDEIAIVCATQFNNNVIQFRHQSPEAKKLYEEALSDSKRLLGNEHWVVANSLKNFSIACTSLLRDITSLYVRTGQYSEVMAALEELLCKSKTVLGSEHEVVAEVLKSIEVVCRAQLHKIAAMHDQKLAEMSAVKSAVTGFQEVLSDSTRMLGDEHSVVFDAYCNIMRTYEGGGKHLEAVRIQEVLFRLTKKRLGGEHPDVAAALDTIAALHKKALASVASEIEPQKQALSSQQATEAVLHFKELLGISKRTFGDQSLLTAATLNGYAAFDAARGKYASALARRKKALLILIKLQGDLHPDVTDTLTSIAILHRRQGAHAESAEVLAVHEKLVRITKERLLLPPSSSGSSGDMHLSVGDALVSVADLHQENGRYAEAIEVLQEALDVKQTSLGAEHQDVVAVRECIAALHERQEHHREALGEYEEVLRVTKLRLGGEHEDVARALDRIALVCQKLNKHAQALESFKQSYAITCRALGAEHRIAIAALCNIAAMCEQQERYPEALERCEEALRLKKTRLGDEHRDVAEMIDTIARIYTKQEAYPKALEALAELLRGQQKSLGGESLDVAVTLHKIAFVEQAQGRSDAALERLEESLRIAKITLLSAERLLETDDALQSTACTAVLLRDIADLHAQRGEYATALECLEGLLLPLSRAELGDEHSEVGEMHLKIGFCMCYLDRFEAALGHLEKGLQIQRQALGLESVRVADVQVSMAEICDKVGKHDQAQELYKASAKTYARAHGAEHSKTVNALRQASHAEL